MSILRIFFIILSAFAIGFLTYSYTHNFNNAILGGLLGSAIACIAFLLELLFKQISIKALAIGVLGLVFGLVCAYLINYSLIFFGFQPFIQSLLSVSVTLILGYLGFIVGVKKSAQLSWESTGLTLSRSSSDKDKYILDTSVIIDGRIADIYDTGFLTGRLLIPRFVLKELQYIADSPDPIKRKRGRRGLDILNRLQSINAPVEIVETDFPNIPEVDAKLVELAKSIKAKIITNDFNLNKIANLEGIDVLNINQLANALKPVLLPGETFKIFIVKEGKEYNQGVGYLDDGTMVVVEGGKDYINQWLEVTVTSILQTSAGRMIFAEIVAPA